MRLELEYESIATIRRTLAREGDARENEAARWEQAAAAELTPARKRAAEELAAYCRRRAEACRKALEDVDRGLDIT